MWLNTGEMHGCMWSDEYICQTPEQGRGGVAHTSLQLINLIPEKSISRICLLFMQNDVYTYVNY